MVETDGEIGDDLNLLGQALDHLGAEMLGMACDDRIRAAGAFDQLVLGI